MKLLYDKIRRNLDNCAFIRAFDEAQKTPDMRQYHHLNHSAQALMSVRAWEKSGKNLLIISQDDIIAEDIWDDLCVLIGKEKACYLPDYEILPYEERSPHYSIRAARMDTLIRTLDDTPKIYSLSLRALLRWIIPLKNLQSHIIKLSTGMSYPPEKLMGELVQLGYEIEYQVGKIFQAARRGGIIDVYSPSSAKPCRIEYFGDEIFSIRHFSLGSQRSEPGDIKEITIIPSRELCLNDIDSVSPLARKAKRKGFFEGIENYYSLLVPKLQTFAEYFDPAQVQIVWNNFNYILEESEQIMEQALFQFEKLIKNSSEQKVPRPDKMLADSDYIMHLVRKFPSVFFSHSEFVLPFSVESIPAPIYPQKGFAGDLVKLSEELNALRRNSCDTILLFDNESQSNRMQQLLDDYDVLSAHHIGVLHNGFSIPSAKLAIYTDHEIFNRYKRKRYTPRYSAGEQIVDYTNLKPGDYIVHIDHGIGVFEGLKLIRLEGQDIECLCLRYADEDKVYVPTFQLQLISKYVAEEGALPTLHKLGSVKWHNTKRKAKEQIELVAADIIKLYAERSKRMGVAHQADHAWQKELEASFIYEDTPDQVKAAQEIKEDMELPAPMERLLCGDVGFGKTEVAIRAAFKAVMSGYQVAVLVPTTLLAEQHYRVFKERLAQYPVRIAMFSRFRTSAQISKDLSGLALGQIDIAIGTHRIISKDVRFEQLGLLIIDEEHRFGVRHKERLRNLQSNVDTLYMSATPIPRTLNMALAKLKEISLMQTSPKERLPIRTIITPRDIEVIKDAIRREIDRGGQVFFLHNRVQTIETVATELREAMPNIRFGIGHAQLSEHQLEKVMDDFVDHEYDVLISTTIIENGIDIPNANTIIVDRADTFGLAQLYQIRGRVGRSNRRAYAYLLIPNATTQDARHRLDALTQYDYLGAGFQVALRDLEIRGAGTILGIKQSGVIQSIGFNYYNHLLDKAIESITKEQPELFSEDEQPDTRHKLRTEVDLYFPPDYISDDEERLRIYRRLNEIESTLEIAEFETELQDRFGKIPDKAKWLLLYFHLNILTKMHNIQNCQVRNGGMILEFDPKRLPSQKIILGLCSQLKQPFRIDGTKGIKVHIELSKHGEISYLDQFQMAINILEMMPVADS